MLKPRGAGTCEREAVTPREVAPQRAGPVDRAAAEEFQLLVDGVKDYAIFRLDRDGHVMSWNAGAERIKQYRADEVLGKHFSVFYEPEERAGGLPARALETATRKGRFEGYGWRVRKDGSRFYAHVTITPLFDEHGELDGFAKVTQDVTAQREAERVLREREQQLAEAQAIAQLGSFEWEVRANQVSWSPELCRIFGLEQSAFTSTFHLFVRYVHPDDRPLLVGGLRQAASTGTSFRVEQRVVRPNGEVRFILTRGRVVRDERDRLQRVIGVCQDLTDQLEGERQLAEAHAQAEISRRLQNGLLPVLLLHDPTLVVRTRYLPGQERALLGADFYDGLDKVLWSNQPSDEMFATACCLWVAPGHRSVTVALAGHPPPLLASGGKVTMVAVAAGPALGILEESYPWEADTVEVGDAWMLLCYTDGLIEGLRAPGSVERFGIEGLSDAAAKLLEGRPGADDLLDGLLDVVVEANGEDLSDDIAMLCLATVQQPGSGPTRERRQKGKRRHQQAAREQRGR